MLGARTGGRRGRPSGQDGPVKVIVLSDTHAPRRWRSCPPAVAGRLRGADLILHAGDVCTARVLDELKRPGDAEAVRKQFGLPAPATQPATQPATRPANHASTRAA